MIEKRLLVENKNGIHARPSAAIVGTLSGFSSEVIIKTDDGEADARSIMAILMLKILCGTEISIVANGDDEVEAINALEKLFKEKFGFDY
ncbi:MAG: HPr family phosphocarrier protein [Chitinispirillales bacterium]|nr:HPr family phosphocarrier protein [Chitinispirillales bacterium]